jgi:hypothetical protein
MALPPVLNSIIAWLRAGYPEGVPNVDYIPLFALLASQLTDADVAAIAGELAAVSDPASGRRSAMRSRPSPTKNRLSPMSTGSVPGLPRVAGRWPGPASPPERAPGQSRGPQPTSRAGPSRLVAR